MILYANCHLAKFVDIEVPQAVLPDSAFEAFLHNLVLELQPYNKLWIGYCSCETSMFP
jgi:hypothetical protein